MDTPKNKTHKKPLTPRRVHPKDFFGAAVFMQEGGVPTVRNSPNVSMDFVPIRD
jgi:hypothetical protein